MTLSKKLTISLTSIAVLGLLAACSNQTTQSSESSSSSQQVSSSNSSSQAENLDGTYTGTDEDSQITLTISGTSGTWEEVDNDDGETETRTVTVNADNHTLTVGDDTKSYTLEGNQLTIKDDDLLDSDTVVLTKQHKK